MRSILKLCVALALVGQPPSALADAFELRMVTEASIGIVGLSFVGAGAVLKTYAAPPGAPDLETLIGIDRALMAPWSGTLDLASQVAVGGCLAAPSALALGRQPSQMLTIAVMYAETLVVSWGIKETLKALLPRYRPYMYQPIPPADLAADEDRYFSFPSGHTTLAFASAVFGSYVFATLYPESRWKIPVAITALGMASLTAALRVGAGEHFLTDVAAGAAAGIFCGFVVPALHRTRAASTPQVESPAARESALDP